MDNVKLFSNDGVSQALEYLNELYHRGELAAIVCGVKLKNDECLVINSQTLNYLENIGVGQLILQHTISNVY